MVDPNQVKSIFLAALEKPPAEREIFVEQATGGDDALRARVMVLVQAHDDPDAFLDKPAAIFGPTVDLSSIESPQAEHPGSVIGRYKILEQIGEGGMGVVYMADQQAPVRRRVALKIIKTGMDTRQVIARFEAERQALALMDHPNIARVLDAGATDSGRPYFVMELVRGIPITEYCDQNNLPVHKRLELFIEVCHAVQHAHQKGIIHRDLKPSNVLVTINDGRPVPKVIDFGVAKATNQQLTEKTLFTAFAQMVGTPLYMSPEQAEMTSLDIDTRSDIYSLGVLLYELLTGTTPFDQQRLREAAFDEMRRIIREEEPPKPSTRISTLEETRIATAARRQVDSRRLSQLVKGDLDWIVMKSLEKDRTRRYDTANDLAADVLRHLGDEPVEACPPSASYRLRKFIRRNRAAASAVMAMFVILAAGIVTSSIFAASASREAAAAKDSLAKAKLQKKRADGVNAFFTEEVFGLADPGRAGRVGVGLMDVLDLAAGKIDERFPDDPEQRAVVHDRFGEVYIGIDEPTRAVKQLEKAVSLRSTFAGALDPSTMKSRSNLGLALHNANQYSEAKEVLESTLADQSKVLGKGDPDTIQTAVNLGLDLMEINDKHALEFGEQTYQQARAFLGPRHPLTLDAQNIYGWILRWRGLDPQKGLENAEPAAVGLREVMGAEYPRAMFAAYNYGACLFDLHRYKEAAAVFEPLLAVRYRVLGPTHIDSLYAAWRLALCRQLAGDKPGALAVLEEVHANLKSIETLENTKRGDPLKSMAAIYVGLGRNDRAAEFYAVVYRMYLDALRSGDPHKVDLGHLSILLTVLTSAPQAELRNYDWAVELATKACEITNYQDPDLITALATALAAQGDYEAAIKILDKSVGQQQGSAQDQYHYALIRLRGGDLPGYQKACAAMSKQFAASADADSRFWFTWSCGLGLVAKEDLIAPLKQARDFVAQDPKNPGYRDALGILLYRTGNYEEAAKQLSEAIDDFDKNPEANNWAIYPQFFLAMAKHQLGDKAEAKRLLAEAQTAMNKEVKANPLWDRQALLEIFRREAESMIAPTGLK